MRLFKTFSFRGLFQHRLIQFSLVTPLILLFSLFLYARSAGKCEMGSNLGPVFKTTVDILNQNKIEYWLEFGTLLGAVRDQEIIPFEFDIDIGVREETCESILKLRTIFEENGLAIFGRGEFISYNYMPPMYDGFINAPCARAYSENRKYYVDIYWFRKMEAEQILADPTINYIPSDWNKQDPLFCGKEAWEDLSKTGTPGGCRMKEDLWPLKPLTFLGKSVAIPAKSEKLLGIMYGEDWRIPQAKGYKMLACGPNSWLLLVLSGLLLSACLFFVAHPFFEKLKRGVRVK